MGATTYEEKIYIPLTILAALVLFFIVREHVAPPNQVVKEAVKKPSLRGDYILCQRVKTTGFDWYRNGCGRDRQ